MLHSHSHLEQEFDFFATFLQNAIDGDSKYRELVNPIILDAQKLATKELDYFKVNRNSFDIIVFLAQKEPDFISQINIQSLTVADYKHILDIIKDQRSLILA